MGKVAKHKHTQNKGRELLKETGKGKSKSSKTK